MIYHDKVRCTYGDGIATVVIDSPPVNSLTAQVLNGLDDCFADLASNTEIRAVILTGEGKAFVAGADIKEFVTWTPETAGELSDRGQKLFTRIENFPVPIIAAINGYALGGGLELALVCDIRLASEKAKLGVPETSLGIIPAYGGTSRLPRIVGSGWAKRMIFTGEHLTAAKALEIGLVQEVVPPEELMDEALLLAERIAQNAPVAVREAKRAVNAASNLTLEQSLALETEISSICFASEDKVEGIDAFIAKRTPVFQNK